MSDLAPSLMVPASGQPSSLDPDHDGRFFSRAKCAAVFDRILAQTHGGGDTKSWMWSVWSDNMRWARNVVATGGETEDTRIEVARQIRGAGGSASTNAADDEGLRLCVLRAEHLSRFAGESPDTYPLPRIPFYPHTKPVIWFDRTVSVDEGGRAASIDQMIAPAASAGLLSAGFLQVSAVGSAYITNGDIFRYYPYSTAQCSVTVRDPKGRGSGWAGVDWNDIARIDMTRLAQIAVDKCVRSRNPVAIEPGRYTAILEPQAVCDLVSILMSEGFARHNAEQGSGPFADPLHPGYSRIGQRVMDPRVTFSADPMDPDCGFLPFDGAEPYTAVRWIENGVLKALAYDRAYGRNELGDDHALPNSGALHMSGGTSTIDDMIASTTRGVLVTRFNNIRLLDFNSMLMNGNTRDGFWLIEHGKISKAIKNFRFTESPMFVLNNIEMLGAPQRVFHPNTPMVVPPLKVRDFSFTGLVDAV